MATRSSILAWRIPMDRGACWTSSMGLQSVQTWLRRLSTAQHRSIYNCIPLLKDNSGTDAYISGRNSHWHETSERRENIKCGLRTIASEPSVWNIILLPESNRGGGLEQGGATPFGWNSIDTEGVPSLPHCLGNSHRGTSGQMQSTKHAEKHISSLKPMGAHLVNQQEGPHGEFWRLKSISPRTHLSGKSKVQANNSCWGLTASGKLSWESGPLTHKGSVRMPNHSC